jgi:hypothetical protein
MSEHARLWVAVVILFAIVALQSYAIVLILDRIKY